MRLCVEEPLHLVAYNKASRKRSSGDSGQLASGLHTVSLFQFLCLCLYISASVGLPVPRCMNVSRSVSLLLVIDLCVHVLMPVRLQIYLFVCCLGLQP